MWIAVLLSVVVCADAVAQEKRLIAPPNCRQAVSESRLICLNGSDCQREISRVLQICDTPTTPACMAARDELRTYCSKPLPWDSSRGCDGALRQVAHYCGR
jgi:hypothetical protein